MDTETTQELCEKIRKHVASGGAMALCTCWRTTYYWERHFIAWEKIGKRLIRPDADGVNLRLRHGKQSLYVFPYQIKLGRFEKKAG